MSRDVGQKSMIDNDDNKGSIGLVDFTIERVEP